MDNGKGLSTGKNVAWNSIGSLVYLGCNWLITVLVVIIYPTFEASGCLAAAMAAGNVVAAIVLFKVRAFQVSDVSNSFQTSDYIALRIFCSVSGFIFIGLYAIASVSESAFVATIVYAIFKILESFIDVLHGVDQRHDRLDIAGISQITRGALVLACFTAISICTNNLILAIGGMALSTLLVTLFFDIPATRKLENIKPAINLAPIANLAKACAPGFISSVFLTMTVSLSRQLFGLEYGDEQLGIYAAIATPAVIIQAMASYIYAPLLGPIAMARLNRDFKKIRRTMAMFFVVLTAMTITICGLFVLIADPMFTLLFGSDISKYTYLIQPVLLSTALTAAEYFILDMLIVFRKPTTAALTCTLSFIASLALIGPLSASFGMNGISFTICIAFICSITVSIPFLWRETNPSLNTQP